MTPITEILSTLFAILLLLQEVLTKALEEEFCAKVNPKYKIEILFLIFNNPNFKALCASSLPNYIKEMVFAKLLKDPPSLFRLQFNQHFKQLTASHLNNTLLSF